MDILFYVLFALGGAIAGFLLAKVFFDARTVDKSAHDSVMAELQLQREEAASRLTRQEVEEKYVSKDAHEVVNAALVDARIALTKKDERIIELTGELGELKQRETSLIQKLQNLGTEMERLQLESVQHFKTAASTIFEEKRTVFIAENKREIETLLDPFKRQLTDFKDKVEKTREDDVRDLTSLKKEIEALNTLNVTLHEDAQNLTNALKGDVRVQGDWGEDRLRMILQAEGLEKHIDFTLQERFKDEDEEKTRKPDFVLKLPDEKHIVIDSKVSLVAYINYFSATDPGEKREFLKAHIKSVTDHIDSLGKKNYQNLVGMNSPDYVFMFMPVEPALTLAMTEDKDLLSRAMKKHIVLITPSTLIATLKVVKVIWQKEKRVENVEKIFEECGKLYDKFVMFMNDMDRIESGLNTALGAYKEAMKNLSEGQRRGVTMIGRFERIKELEAHTTKLLSSRYLAAFDEPADDDPGLLLEGSQLEEGEDPFDSLFAEEDPIEPGEPGIEF